MSSGARARGAIGAAAPPGGSRMRDFHSHDQHGAEHLGQRLDPGAPLDEPLLPQARAQLLLHQLPLGQLRSSRQGG